ncbi:hypothetical protein INS49_009332 [Diaporthe citri]|uniref:uncharacterized protein n=1 Tax=Diaporthe citri TaxID=83186 RepID=UPI001C826BBE|nr:uncharacterized protein INS49_009332 [Diaporthe citri]KAG6361108.1 hypothetical protein INS49_009332 [Diaporthe citri]
MLTSILGLRSPLINILNPNFLTLALLPSDSDKSPAAPTPSSETSPSGAQDGPSLKTLATISILSGTLGLAAMTAFQSLTGYLFLLALFGPTGARSYMTEFLRADVSALAPEQLASRAAMAREPRYTIFLALFAPFSAALPEELLKYLPVLWVRRKAQAQEGRDRQLDKRAAVSAATAASLGFALVELAAYVQAAAATSTGPPMAVTLSERVLVGLPGHVAMAVLSASRGAGADAGGDESPRSGWRDVFRAVAPSVLYHALFDFVLFGSSAWVGGHVGWVHPEGVRAVAGTLGACVCVQGVLYAHTARSWLGWGEKSKRE